MSLSFVASPVTLITASNKTRFRNPTSFLNKIVSRRSLPQRPSKLAPSKFFGHRLRFEIIPCAYTCALKVCAKHVTTSDDEWSVSLADDDLEDEESDRESDDDVSKEMWHRIKEAFESPVLNSDVLDEKEVLTKVSTSNMVLERGELMNSTWMPGDLKSFQRSCTLKDLDLGAMGEAGAVEVNMDVQQIEEADWYVTADIVADTKLRCDRCGCHFRRKTTGTFAVWVTCDQELSKFNDVGDGDECDGVLVLTSRMTGVDLGQVQSHVQCINKPILSLNLTILLLCTGCPRHDQLGNSFAEHMFL